MNFDIDCLRSFLVVVDTMNFSRAAETVGRSQSTISQQIAKLEAQVGKALLLRRRGRLTEMTIEGDRLAQFARRILHLNDEAYASMRGESLTEFVRVGVPLDFFGNEFTKWLARFKDTNPNVAFEVEATMSENLMKRSSGGEFDLAFFKQEAGMDGGSVVITEQMVWACGPSFVMDDSSIPLVLFPDGCAYRRCAISSLEEQGRGWHLGFVSPSFECVRTAAIEGLGVTVLAHALVHPPLRIIRQDMLPRLPAVELAYRSGRRANSRAVVELTAYLMDKLTRKEFVG